MAQYCVQIDGSSRFNPGPSGIGVRITDGQGRVVKALSRFIGDRTNNQAEYEALICGLTEAEPYAREAVVFCTDSALLYHQLNGRYRVKDPELKALHARALELLSGFTDASLKLVSRTDNKDTDRLARTASADQKPTDVAR